MTYNIDWKSLIISIFDFLKGVFIAIINLLKLPTTPYGLVKFIAENNYLIFGNKTLSKIVLVITPFIVSMIITFLIKLMGVKKTGKIASILTLVAYLVMLYLFSYPITWVIIGLIIVALIISLVIRKSGNAYYD